MRALLQPDDSGLCAQTSVAMVADVTLEQAVAACGSVSTCDGLDLEQIRRGLAALGVTTGKLLTGKNMKVPRFAVASVSDGTAWSHAVVVRDGFVYDPAVGYPLPFWVFERFFLHGAYARCARVRSRHRSFAANWDWFLPVLGHVPLTAANDSVATG